MNSFRLVLPAGAFVVSSEPSDTQHKAAKDRSGFFDLVSVNRVFKKLFQPLKAGNFFAVPALGSAFLALSGCTGGTIAQIMPGTTVTIDGIPFTVSDSQRGLTVRNFETDVTSPAILQAAAARAAEQVSGCRATAITQDTGVNTYHVAVTCPEA